MRLYQTIQAQGIPATLQAINQNLVTLANISVPREQAIDMNLALAKCLHIRLILADSKGRSPSDTLDAISRIIIPFTDGPASPADSAPADSNPPPAEPAPETEAPVGNGPSEQELPTAGEE